MKGSSHEKSLSFAVLDVKVDTRLACLNEVAQETRVCFCSSVERSVAVLVPLVEESADELALELATDHLEDLSGDGL